jgi:hypothetical protein
MHGYVLEQKIPKQDEVERSALADQNLNVPGIVPCELGICYR